MDEKDKNSFRGLLNKCFIKTNVYVMRDYEVIFPIFPISLMEGIITFIEKKLRDVLTIYDENDIMLMILFKIVPFLSYDELRKKVSNSTEFTYFIPVAQLPDLLDKAKFITIADNVIEELVNPSKSYALVQLPDVKLGENIRITSDLFLVADMADYFRIDDDRESFGFRFESNETYLLIEQTGWNWRPIESIQSLVYKNLLHKLKIFLGLSLIMDILKTASIPINRTRDEKNISLPIGIFSVAPEWSEGLWWEGVPEEDNGWYDPIPKDHPDFDALRNSYSGGDELKEFCFQKRFYIENEITLPQIYVNLLNSLTITEYATKPSFNLIKGEIKEPLPHFEKLEKPGEFLRKKFEKPRIILNSNDDYAERIKAASLWYLEGYCAESDTFKFIDYTIAVESLLGEQDRGNKENVPITETLSSRCGFWLGESLKEKQEIKRQFKKEIYKTRSKIIHTGKTILNKDDNENLKILEKWTKQLIADAIKTYNSDDS